MKGCDKMDGREKCTIIGYGRWGAALAWLFGRMGFDVRVYDRNRHIPYQKNCIIEDVGDRSLFANVRIYNEPAYALIDTSVVFVVINAHRIGELINKLQSSGFDMSDKTMILCMKGMSPDGLFLPEKWLAAFPKSRVAVLGGPCQPAMLYEGTPAVMGIAANSRFSGVTAKSLCDQFSSPLVKFKPSENVLGAAICGVSKNILGFVGGMLDGYDLSDKKPIFEELFMVEAGLIIEAFDEDSNIVEGTFYADDNQVTLYYEGSQNVISGRDFVTAESLDGLTPCEAFYSAVPLARRLESLGLAGGLHSWVAEFVSNKKPPSPQTIQDVMHHYLQEYFS
jgi:glycerol-3-phosphate dehydrogenase